MSSLLQPVHGYLSTPYPFYLIAGISFTVMVIWEFFSPHKRVGEKVRARSYRTNLINLLFNNLILYLVSVQFFYTLATYRSWEILPRMGEIIGVEMNSLPGLLIQFLILDFLIYIWHILNHKSDFLWNWHKAHHSDHDLNTSTGIRFHIGELLLSLLYKGMIVLVLGIPPEMMAAFEFITVYAAIFHHSNIRVPGESLLRFLFIMPSHHATHHSVPRHHHDSNYGVVFSFWDYLLRTRNPHQPNRFGLARIPEMDFPHLLRFSFSLPYLIGIAILLLLLLLIRWYGTPLFS